MQPSRYPPYTLFILPPPSPDLPTHPHPRTCVDGVHVLDADVLVLHGEAAAEGELGAVLAHAYAGTAGVAGLGVCVRLGQFVDGLRCGAARGVEWAGRSWRGALHQLAGTLHHEQVAQLGDLRQPQERRRPPKTRGPGRSPYSSSMLAAFMPSRSPLVLSPSLIIWSLRVTEKSLPHLLVVILHSCTQASAGARRNFNA